MPLREELANICHKVYEKEFVAAYDGNLSVRISDDRFLITPSGKCKGELTADDFIEIDSAGKKISGKGKASTESKIHLIAYKNRADVHAVIHCHPVYSTAFAATGESLNRAVFPEVILGLGKVPLCRYATPSTKGLVDSMIPAVEHARVLLLENHGAVSFGKNIRDAYYLMEKLEHFSKTLFIARQIGREKALPLLKVKELYDIAEDTYGIKVHPKNRLDVK